MFNAPLHYAYLIVILLIIVNMKYLRALHYKNKKLHTRPLIIITKKT